MASKKIENISSVSKLEYIKKHVCQLSLDKIENAVNAIRNLKTIDKLMRIFSNLNNNFAEEEECLQQYEQTHNKKYANDDNQRFSTAYNSLACIKGRIFGMYQIMNAFSRKQKKKEYKGWTETSSLEFQVSHSLIGDLETTKYLFNNMTSRQKRLVEEIGTFLKYLDNNLETCIRVIHEEERIKSNKHECLRQLNEQINELYGFIKGQKVKKIDTEILNDLMNADEHPENAQKWYHQLTPKKLAEVATISHDRKLMQYPNNLRNAYQNNVDDMNNFISAVSHLDECVSKITSKTLMWVQRYTNFKESHNRFYDCFKEIYESNDGKNHIVSKQTFNNECTTHYNDITDAYYEFETKMDMYTYNTSSVS